MSPLIKRRSRRVFAVFAAITLLAGCGGSDTSGPSGGGGSNDLLTIGVAGLGSQNWNPAIASNGEAPVKGLVGDTLFRRNPETRELEPGLAESWELAPDGSFLKVKLRPNVPFHGGYGNLTAEDVKFTYEQFIGPDSDRGNQALALMQAVGETMDSFEVVNDLEFTIHSADPSPLILVALANGSTGNAMYIQSKKYWEEKPEEALVHPIGTGPFEFVSSTPGVDVKLKAVENHWRQTPAFKNLTYSIIPDDAARLAQVQSGQIDIAFLPANLAREAADSGIEVFSAENHGSMTVMLGGQYENDPAFDRDSPWIQADKPEAGQKIREALSVAIDREGILEAVLAGEGEITSGPLIQYNNIAARTDDAWKPPVYDPDRAKQLLAEGGFPNGFDITFQLYESRPGNGAADIGEAIASNWEDIGIKVNRQVISDEVAETDYIKKKNTAGIAYVRFDPFFDEPLQTIQCCYVPIAGQPHMFDQYVIDAWEKMRSEPDQGRRDALGHDVIQHLIDTVRVIPLFTTNQSFALGPRIASWDGALVGEGTINAVETITPAN